jgi:hypothetical protein
MPEHIMMRQKYQVFYSSGLSSISRCDRWGGWQRKGKIITEFYVQIITLDR